MPKLTERFIVNQKGKTTAVVVPIRRYEKLLEDLHDLSVMAERRDEGTVALAEVRARR